MESRSGSFWRFSASSVICFLLDYGLFTLFNAVLLRGTADGARELAATYAARFFSAAANYLLNRNIVFRDSSDPRRSALRYFVLAVLQAAVSALLVYLTQQLTGMRPLWETAVKIPVDAALFLASYRIQRKWVFRGKG